MKIRSGFVSNSSSSSFILVGVKLKTETLLNNPVYKAQFDKEMEVEQLDLNKDWEKKLNHQDYSKYKTLYETCKENKVSIPQEVQRFFGHGFNGVFEPMKPCEKDLLREMVLEKRFKFPKGISTISDDGPIYLGKIFASGDDCLDNGSVSLDTMTKYVEELVNIGFEEKDIRIYYGTVAS